MKKKLLIIIPIILMLTGVGIFLFFCRDRRTTISVGNWDSSKADFTLCEIKTDFYTVDESYTLRFDPTDEESFLKESLRSEAYVREYQFPMVGSPDNPGYLFCYDEGLFSLTRFSGGEVWYLTASVTKYDPEEEPANKFTYYTPGEYFPDNSELAEYNCLSFDEFFGNYEESVECFYGLLSDAYVSFDQENQVIYVAVQDWYSQEIVDDRYVEIDFINKTVLHKIVEETEE